MVEASHVRLNLPDRTYQASVRSEINRIAKSIGFTAHSLGEVDIVVAEITSNLIKHTRKGGYILVRPMTDRKGIELIAIDEGPGMRVAADMLQDGTSTTSTLGHGLGAIKRLSSEFDIYSMPGWGTILLSRIEVKRSRDTQKPPAFRVEGINVPKPGETVSGDSWLFLQKGRRLHGLVVDGLGHGTEANLAAENAVAGFCESPAIAPTEQLGILHRRLKKTRGAVANIVSLDLANKQLQYSGVGNISMKILSTRQSRGCLSYNGIVGHIMPATINNHTLQWQGSDMFIIHSDGLNSRWDLGKYPGIMNHHPILLCAALYKDHSRGTDDTTVVFGKPRKS